jgi:hypothetical protein
MEFLSRLNLTESERCTLNPDNLIFEIGDIQVYASSTLNTDTSTSTPNTNPTVYHDVCGFLFKESDNICICKGKTLKPASRDDIRSAIVKMHSSIPLTPTEESASLLYKMLSGCKKKKSRGKKDEEEELDEDDDEEVLRIVRKKDSGKVPLASTLKKTFVAVAAKKKEDSDDEDIEVEEENLEDDEELEEQDDEQIKEEEEGEDEEGEEEEEEQEE